MRIEQQVRSRLQVWNLVVRWSAWILFLTTLASPCWSNELSQTPASLAPVHLGDVKIILDQATSVDATVANLSFEVHQKLKAALPNVTLGWNPVEYLGDAKLRCLQDDKQTPLSIGRDASTTKSDFILVVGSREQLKEGQSVELSLRVPRPDLIRPGIYFGELKFRFFAPEQLNEDIFGAVRIFVAVRGRRLVDFRFLAAKNDQIRFGRPADVRVIIDTIDCELEHGEFQFSQQPIVAAAPQLLTLKLPFAEPFHDPKDDLELSKYPTSWRKTAFWTEESPTSDIPGKAKLPPQFCDLKRHSITLHLGECNDLGSVQGRIKWPQSKNAPGRDHPVLELLAEAKVLEGIKAFPRLAFRNEPIELSLASRVNLGPEVRMVLVGRDEANRPVNRPVQLKKSEPLTGGDASKVQVSGQPHMYSAKFTSTKYGKFKMHFPDEVVKQHPDLEDLAHESPEIQVWLARNETTEKDPLRVFASSTPFWWGLSSDEFKGSGWHEERAKMMKFDFDKSHLAGVAVKLTSMNARPPLPVATASDPTPNLTIGDSLHLANTPWSVTTPWTPLKSPLSLQGEVLLQKEKPPELGLWKFPLRMQIRGTADGASVVRIVEWTVHVEVTTAGVYYRRIIWWVVGGFAFVGLLYWMYRRANPRGRSIPSPAYSFGGIGGSHPTDDLSDFVSPTNRPGPVADSPKTPAQHKSESSPRDEPRRDDLDDFLRN